MPDRPDEGSTDPICGDAEKPLTTRDVIMRILRLEERGRLAALLQQVDIDQQVIAELEAQAVIDRTQIGNLESALNTARRIGAALGILMSSYKITEAEAFATLRLASQHTNRKLREVADDVVLTGEAPSDTD